MVFLVCGYQLKKVFLTMRRWCHMTDLSWIFAPSSTHLDPYQVWKKSNPDILEKIFWMIFEDQTCTVHQLSEVILLMWDLCISCTVESISWEFHRSVPFTVLLYSAIRGVMHRWFRDYWRVAKRVFLWISYLGNKRKVSRASILFFLLS